ncbi:hypothetical protein R1A27_28530 [Methylobacterium sp. NMS12]|uniref:hypothetical protein n=1 Tax=Methylobacterium sp. NMS12 TaxID=3079766 RepID=UPI003F88229F
MSDGAFVTTLPEHLSTLRQSSELHVPQTPVNGLLRKCLLLTLGRAEVLSMGLASVTPAPAAQQQFHAPLGERSPAVEEPRVPRHSGHDPRLPGNRPHP